MKVTRRFTCAGKDPYETIEFEERLSEIRNPDGTLVFSMDGVKVPGRLVAGRGRRAGPEILPQGGSAADRRGRQPGGLGERRAAHRARARRASGLRSTRRVLDPLGQRARLLRLGRRRRGFPRRALLHARRPVRGAQLSAVVQHRPALGVRHHRPGPGPLVRGPEDRQAQDLIQRV